MALSTPDKIGKKSISSYKKVLMLKVLISTKFQVQLYNFKVQTSEIRQTFFST